MSAAILIPTRPDEREDGMGRRGWTLTWVDGDGSRRGQCFHARRDWIVGRLAARGVEVEVRS